MSHNWPNVIYGSFCAGAVKISAKTMAWAVLYWLKIPSGNCICVELKSVVFLTRNKKWQRLHIHSWSLNQSSLVWSILKYRPFQGNWVCWVCLGLEMYRICLGSMNFLKLAIYSCTLFQLCEIAHIVFIWRYYDLNLFTVNSNTHQNVLSHLLCNLADCNKIWYVVSWINLLHYCKCFPPHVNNDSTFWKLLIFLGKWECNATSAFL